MKITKKQYYERRSIVIGVFPIFLNIYVIVESIAGNQLYSIRLVKHS